MPTALRAVVSGPEGFDECDDIGISRSGWRDASLEYSRYTSTSMID